MSTFCEAKRPMACGPSLVTCENRRRGSRCIDMRAKLRAAVLVVLPCLCVGCEPPPDGEAPSEPVLAKVVTAPMAARERLLHDLEIEKQRANDRAGQMQDVIDSSR